MHEVTDSLHRLITSETCHLLSSAKWPDRDVSEEFCYPMYHSEKHDTVIFWTLDGGLIITV